jgi:urease accessory protein
MSALAALLQLSSATLPVGAYSYSQGLESAIEAGWVSDELSARQWIETVLSEGIARTEAVIVARTFDALAQGSVDDLALINARFLASRETRELLAETLQMGRSMRLLVASTLGVDGAVRQQLDALEADEGLGYPIAWAVAAMARGLDTETALLGYLYAALENLVLAAVKTVPLGQSAGQRLLTELGQGLPMMVSVARDCPLDELTNFLPGQIMASMQHEHQHTRLFRS